MFALGDTSFPLPLGVKFWDLCRSTLASVLISLSVLLNQNRGEGPLLSKVPGAQQNL